MQPQFRPCPRPRSSLAATALLLALGLLAGGCAATGSGAQAESAVPGGPWLVPSPLLAQQLEDEARRLPWTHGIEHLEQIRWFASVGEPAYPTLLELAADEREHVAAAALAALGATHDRRLVEHLRAVPWPGSEEQPVSEDLRLERARTLVRLGDWSEMPTLIAGLTSERLRTRALCDQALYEATRQRFGYDPRAAETEREKAVRAWENWWLSRTGEGLLLTDG